MKYFWRYLMKFLKSKVFPLFCPAYMYKFFKSKDRKHSSNTMEYTTLGIIYLYNFDTNYNKILELKLCRGHSHSEHNNGKLLFLPKWQLRKCWRKKAKTLAENLFSSYLNKFPTGLKAFSVSKTPTKYIFYYLIHGLKLFVEYICISPNVSTDFPNALIVVF